MSTLTSLSNEELLARLPLVRSTERRATADVIAYLAEIDRRRLYLGQACSSLHAFCVERLGYSEEEAVKRMKVARLCLRLPHVLAELESGAIHLTGLYVLAPHLTAENADALLAEARGKTRREIEALLARWFPRPDDPGKSQKWDVLSSITPLPEARSSGTSAIPGTSDFGARAIPETSGSGTTSRFRLEPLSASSYRVEFTAGAALYEKLVFALALHSHAHPSGDLAAVIECGLDRLLDAETRRRFGAGKPRKQRQPGAGSRHIPLEVARRVWERDGFQCTYVDEQGRRCAEKRYLTLEHKQPFALGGASTVENLCLLCSPHNAEAARQVYGEAFVKEKQLEADAFAKVQRALEALGFERKRARAALAELQNRGVEPTPKTLLRNALAALTP